jgi:predicted amidohydrolase YtcJ
MNLNLEGTNTRDEFLAKVKERVAQTEKGNGSRGAVGSRHSGARRNSPTARELDAIAPEHPVFLGRADGHASVANSAALRLAGITAETASPFGGEILKEKDGGAPTGMLLDHAQELVEKHIPQPSTADKEQALALAAKRSVELGWCQVQNAGSSLEDVAIMRRLSESGKLKLRILQRGLGARARPAERMLEDGAVIGAYGARSHANARSSLR